MMQAKTKLISILKGPDFFDVAHQYHDYLLRQLMSRRGNKCVMLETVLIWASKILASEFYSANY